MSELPNLYKDLEHLYDQINEVVEPPNSSIEAAKVWLAYHQLVEQRTANLLAAGAGEALPDAIASRVATDPSTRQLGLAQALERLERNGW